MFCRAVSTFTMLFKYCSHIALATLKACTLHKPIHIASMLLTLFKFNMFVTCFSMQLLSFYFLLALKYFFIILTRCQHVCGMLLMFKHIVSIINMLLIFLSHIALTNHITLIVIARFNIIAKLLASSQHGSAYIASILLPCFRTLLPFFMTLLKCLGTVTCF